VAPTLDGLTDELFGESVAVDIGGVEEVDAHIERGVDDRFGLVGVEAHAEVVAAKADGADFEGSNVACVHSASVPCVPELVEVELYRSAAEAAVGRTICEVVAPDAWFLKRGTTAAVLADALVGEVVVGVRRRGKLLLVDIGRTTLGMHFGMTGRIVVDGSAPIDRLLYSTHRSDPAFDRFGLRWHGGGLTMSDPRRLGGVELAPDEERLGPDALAISPIDLASVLGRTGRPLKAVLLDQQRVAGIGNLICDETLWRAGLSPMRPASSLNNDEVGQLSRRIKTTIVMLTKRGGSHTGDLQDHRFRGGRCPSDGAELRRDEVGGRTTYWCPQHQR
jgi:formamidopyrimidine-DNA glycosylase